MTAANPVFSPSEFELRNFTNKYLTPEQASQVDLVESRVNGQLDFLAQMLGWSGPNYWTNLPRTVSQKRQLLGGTFGVYDSYVFPRVLSVKTWENIEDFSSSRVAIVETEKDERIRASQTAYLGIYPYTILSLSQTADRMTLNFGEVDDTFFTEINNSTQLRIDVVEARPAPFYRPSIGVAGDNAFHCKDTNGLLTLYPSYDTTELFPYIFPILFAGSVYNFDQPVFLSYDTSYGVDIASEYDQDTERWVLRLPAKLGQNSLGVIAFLSLSTVSSSLQVKIQNWVDPSDWNVACVLDNFIGAWGNKGGPLPFNLAFDSLSIHGFDENTSLFFPEVVRDLEFNDIVDLVYAQRAVIDPGIPGLLPPGKLWWNSSTGKLAVQIEQEEECPFWVEVAYREAPEQEIVPDFVYPDVATFVSESSVVPENTLCVAIVDITGLSSSDNVLGIEGQFTGTGVVYLYPQPGTPYWVPIRFQFTDVTEFEVASEHIPLNVPAYIFNSDGLSSSGSTYTVVNLEITVSGAYETVLVKENNMSDWTLFPDSILKFIANTSLCAAPLSPPQQGELWWDYANPDVPNRNAQIYYGSDWVSLNSNVALSNPPSPDDLTVVRFYCDGNLLEVGESYLTQDFEFSYSDYASSSSLVVFRCIYRAFNLQGRTQFPVIEISDSLTSSYRLDISSLVFSGVVYQMSPNVYDAKTPMRLWKTQHLQSVDSTELLNREIYQNPLIADLNSGPALDNWQRFFIRMPLDYGRNQAVWQKTALICENFAYYGSNVEPEKMDCPPPASLPQIYEEICLRGDRADYTYVYSEPYFYSTVVYDDFASVDASYTNASVRPTVDVEYDEFFEAQFIEYDPLHNRLVDFSPENFGNWQGVYLNVSACGFLSGYYVNDVLDATVELIQPPVWDASIYKFPPTCDNPSGTYSVDANDYKICYAYFVADASAAEDGFFDPQQEAAWRFAETQPETLYIVPNCPAEPSVPIDSTTVFVTTVVTPTFNTVVTPGSGPEGSDFTLTVTTGDVADGTVIPFVVTGSSRVVTTSGSVTISGNSGSATIFTQVSPGASEDLATATLQGIATGQPGTSANFTIISISPPILNFTSTWRNCERLTSFSVTDP